MWMEGRRFEGRLDCIQCIRVLGFTMIALYHIGFGRHYCKSVAFNASVQLFYVITGFLTMYTTRHDDRRTFVRRRLIRILPLYWILTVLIFAADRLLGINLDGEPASWMEFVKSMCLIPYARTSTSGTVVIRPLLGMAWTLYLEVAFVLLFALARAISQRYRGLIASALCAAVWAAAKLSRSTVSAVVVLKSSSWFCFVAGILCYAVALKLWDRPIPTRAGRAALLAAGVAAAVAGYCSGSNAARAACFGVFLCAVVLSLHDGKMPGLLVQMGNLSYSFYLTHYFVVAAAGRVVNFHKLGARQLLMIVPVLLVALVVAKICYEIIEKRLGERLKRLIVRSA